MKGYFQEPENLKALLSEILEWEDTPYRHWCGVKNKGVDCIHFIVEVLKAVGATKGRIIVIPKYDKDWHLHNGKKLLVEGIRKQLDCIEVDPRRPINGDLLLYRFGVQEAHSGIYIDGDVYQALTDIGVQSRRYKERSFYKRMKRAFRITL